MPTFLFHWMRLRRVAIAVETIVGHNASYLILYSDVRVRYNSVCLGKCHRCFRGFLDCSQVLEIISGRRGSVGLSPPRRLPSERGSRARLCTALKRVTRRSRWVFTPGFSRHYASRTTSLRLRSTICLDENCRMPVSVQTGERPGALALPNLHPCKMQGRSPKNPGNCHDAEASRSCHGPCRPAPV